MRININRIFFKKHHKKILNALGLSKDPILSFSSAKKTCIYNESSSTTDKHADAGKRASQSCCCFYSKCISYLRPRSYESPTTFKNFFKFLLFMILKMYHRPLEIHLQKCDEGMVRHWNFSDAPVAAEITYDSQQMRFYNGILNYHA